MSDGKITLKLRFGEFEVQLEGTSRYILDMLEADLPKIIENLSKASKSSINSLKHSGQEFAVAVGESEGYPSIQAKSCSEAITNLLSSAWGRNKPRAIAEIKSAFESNALHYSEKVIGFTLTRLTKKQKLRRWKTETGFVYTMPTVGE